MALIGLQVLISSVLLGVLVRKTQLDNAQPPLAAVQVLSNLVVGKMPSCTVKATKDRMVCSLRFRTYPAV